MKILWVNANFMHPTNKGGSIRTLGILRQLSRQHEIHYAAYENPACPEAPELAREYSYTAYPVAHRAVDKRSPRFALELAGSLFSDVPLAVSRFHSEKMRAVLAQLLERERFDRAVVDHLAISSCYPDLEHSLLFQHNVETVIWRRHVEHARDPLRKAYFRLQADRMLEYERKVCRAAGHTAAVSAVDAELMRTMFGVQKVSVVPTGVDVDYFAPPSPAAAASGLIFIGSMDWLANVDGVTWFARDVLPLIRRKRPECTFTIAGRLPPPEIRELGERDPRIIVTGTVPDVRPFLWGAAVSVVPLRIGGGTRLKIYEAMAAKVPIVSTTIGAEGLEVNPPDDIRIADTAEEFAAECLELLGDREAACRIATAAWTMVSSRFSWAQVAREFAGVLERAPAPGASEPNKGFEPQMKADKR
jgi:glycosyltransferase involved in cell wall biosynthesis